MSYDLMVFEPEAAPKDHATFLHWYHRGTRWEEGHSYSDPSITSARLRGWLADMMVGFPSIDGPFDAAIPEDDASASDYSIAKSFLYAGFAWSRAAVAYEEAHRLAAVHQLGFFDASSPMEEVWAPDDGALRVVHRKEKATLLNRLFSRLVPGKSGS